jgi:hypothetical protein
MGRGDTLLTEIETSPLPPEVAKPKRKGRKAKTEALPASNLKTALAFVSICSRETGQPFQAHTALAMNQALAFDGVTAAGHPITDSIAACPNTEKLLDALMRCTGAFSLTQEATRLIVSSGKFRAAVPCVGFDVMSYVQPDAKIAPLNDTMKLALKLVNPLVRESAPRVVEASACIRANTVVATDGRLLIEAWHGIDLPPGLAVPKSFINAVVRSDLKLDGFGWTPNTSITFWFENGAWIKTQLYHEGYPNTDPILAHPHNPSAVPKDFWAACEAVSGFNEGKISIRPNIVGSHHDEGEGASYDCPGLDITTACEWYQIKLIKDLAETIDFHAHAHAATWQGKLARGVLAKSGEA